MKITHKDKLWEWLRWKEWARSSEIEKWGTANYVNEAGRYARKLAEEGKIVRMNEYEQSLLNLPYKPKERIWKVLHGEPQEPEQIKFA